MKPTNQPKEVEEPNDHIHPLPSPWSLYIILTINTFNLYQHDGSIYHLKSYIKTKKKQNRTNITSKNHTSLCTRQMTLQNRSSYKVVFQNASCITSAQSLQSLKFRYKRYLEIKMCSQTRHIPSMPPMYIPTNRHKLPLVIMLSKQTYK